MKMKQIDKLILLEQSGELSTRQKRQLDACPEAQAKREGLANLSKAWGVQEIDPSPWATTKIIAQLRDQPKQRFIPIRVWSPILATAACITLVMNIIDFRPNPYQNSVEVVLADTEAWGTQFDEDLVALENLVLAISGDPIDIMEM